MICHEAGIDVWELVGLANHHPRVNVLNPAVGVGGHCIAVDPWFLISVYPDIAKNILAARTTNKAKSDWVIDRVIVRVERLRKTLGREPVIACMGLAYKPNIDDLRESPALYITKRLIGEGLEILAVEPHCEEVKGLELHEVGDAVERADVLVFLVGHQLFEGIDTDKEVMDFCGFGF
jgi:UDP-N-acetyl-D-mannosaminuronic acid dehydrogenase